MAKRTIEIKQGETTLVTLYSGPSTWAEREFAVTNVAGFENWDNIEIETVPKLFGNGSYVVGKRITEKALTVDASVTTANVRSVYQGLANAAESLEPVSVLLSGAAIGTTTAFITGINWVQIADNEATFTLTLKSVTGTID